MSGVYKLGDVLETEIVKIIPNGLGLGFAEKLTLFVPLSVPGDKLKVEIADLKGRTAFARIVEVLEPAENRTVPPCEYFGECGGCDFQQMDYGSQMAAKVGIIRDCLRRIAGIEEEIEIHPVPSPEPLGYRIRTQVHADAHTRKIGFFRRQSHDVIEAEHCPILDPDLDDAVREARKEFDWTANVEAIQNIEAAAAGSASSIYAEDVFEPVNELRFSAGGFDFSFNAQTFFQANRFMIEPLIEAVVGGVTGGLAFDLYCGIGLFSLPLARSFSEVVGVESDDEACHFAKKNAAKADLANVRFENQRVRDFLKQDAPLAGRPDVIVIDPPRSGVKKSSLERIIALESERITYVSCNPSTLARDLRILLDAGYGIELFSALDLFPQTHHVEAVVRLRHAA